MNTSCQIKADLLNEGGDVPEKVAGLEAFLVLPEVLGQRPARGGGGVI